MGVGHYNELIEFHVFSQSNCLEEWLGTVGKLLQSFQRARVLGVSSHILLHILLLSRMLQVADAHISIRNTVFKQTRQFGC